MRFHYIASEPNGRIVESDVEAQGPAEVLEWMAKQGLRPVSVKSLGGVEAKGLKAMFSQSITVTDKVFLTKYLALMLRVGTDLFKAIDILIADFDKPVVKSLLIEVRDSLSKGQPFYTTFVKYPKYFDSVFVNLLKAGEASGNLDRVFEDLSKGLEKQQALQNKIKGALTYPIILIVMAVVMLLLLVSYALPAIQNTFLNNSSGVELPLFSRVVFMVGNFFNAYIIIIFPSLLGGVVGGWYFTQKTLAGQKFFSRVISKTPIISEVVYRIALQRFATTLSSLLKSGMPILPAIETTAETVGSAELRSVLIRISREGIAKGLTIGEAFRREPYFPRVVANLIAISEKAGHLESILETLAEFYESEIDSSIKILLSLLEPMLLLGIGGIVAAIALAIIVPIFQLTKQIGG